MAQQADEAATPLRLSALVATIRAAAYESLIVVAYALALEQRLLDAWDSDLFDDKYLPAEAREEQLHEQHAAFTRWLTHLCDALEVVDWRSGEIRERATNA